MRNQITFYCLLSLLMLSSEGFAQETVVSFDSVTGVTPDTAPDAGTQPCTDDANDFCGDTISFLNGFATVDANTNPNGGAATNKFVWFDKRPTNLGGIGASTAFGTPSSDDSAVGGTDWIIVDFPNDITLTRFWMNGDHAALGNPGAVQFYVGGTPYAVVCDSGGECDITEDSVENPISDIDRTGSHFAFSAAAGDKFYLAGIAFAPAACLVPNGGETCNLITTIKVPNDNLPTGSIKQFAPQIVMDPRSDPVTGQCDDRADGVGPVDQDGTWTVQHPNQADFPGMTFDIPYWMCGSPYVAFIATEKDYEIPFGVIDHTFPTGLPAGNSPSYECDSPDPLVESDLSYQTIFAYVTDDPADVIGVRMLELTTGCVNPPKGKSGSLSVLAAGFHIDWRTTDAGTVNDAYLTLLLEKADALRTAIDEAAIAGVISGRNLRQLRNAARVAEEKLISGDCRLASRKLETVINRAGRFTFGSDPEVNHQGRIVARASNMVFTNDNKYCPFQ